MLTAQNILDAANAAGFTDAADLQNGLTILKAFTIALDAAAAANNTSVAALATSFANRASLGVQLQAVNAQLAALSTSQQAANAATELQRQQLQAAANALSASLATA